MKRSALRVRSMIQLSKASSTYTCGAVHMYALAGRAHPNGIVLKAYSYKQAVSLQFGALMSSYLTYRVPCSRGSRGCIHVVQVGASPDVIPQAGSCGGVFPIYPIVKIV